MQIEKLYKSEGVIFTLAFHAALLLLFYLMVLRAPNQPLVLISPSGMDLNVGNQKLGTGDKNNLLAVALVSEKQLDKHETALSSQENNSLVKVSEEAVSPTKIQDAVEINSKGENYDKTEIKPKYSFPRTSSSNLSSFAKGGEQNGISNNPGDSRGTEKGRYLHGNPGIIFEEGFGNWKFIGDFVPNDNSTEEGRVKFILTIDEEGNIINAVPKENLGGVSPSILKIYIQHLKTKSVEPPLGYKINPGMKIPVWYTITAK